MGRLRGPGPGAGGGVIGPPSDTGTAALPAELLALTERLAEHVHNTWVKGRLEEGWRYGPEADAPRKISPLLVPYHQLSEAEKDYDRRTALETLGLTIRLGYRITRP